MPSVHARRLAAGRHTASKRVRQTGLANRRGILEMPARCLHPARGLDRARSPHPRVCGASAAPARTETNFGLRESTRGSTVTEQSTTGLPALPRLPMRLCAADSPRNSPLHFELFFSSLWLRGGPFLGPRLSERRLLSRLLPPEGPPPPNPPWARRTFVIKLRLKGTSTLPFWGSPFVFPSRFHSS